MANYTNEIKKPTNVNIKKQNNPFQKRAPFNY